MSLRGLRFAPLSIVSISGLRGDKASDAVSVYNKADMLAAMEKPWKYNA